jgi:D-amino-acid oxidase
LVRNSSTMSRRSAVAGAMQLLGVAGCATDAPYEVIPPLAPVRADVNRLTKITVCPRPFRAMGPRLDTEQVGDTLVVHNYGHGGNGWSLSWGSGTFAVRKAMAASPREVAVLGCGALGLTSAILAQRAGAKVTINARELMPETRSAHATGLWARNWRIAFANSAPQDFAATWEQMARISFETHRHYIGQPGDPVKWTDQYILSDASAADPDEDPFGSSGFADYHARLYDIAPPSRIISARGFPTAFARRLHVMMFNQSRRLRPHADDGVHSCRR